MCLRTVNVAVAYPIWSGVGATLVTILAWKIHGQKMDGPAILGIALIVGGVVVINTYSKTVSVSPAIVTPDTSKAPGNALVQEE
jgi:small multidrug resistance pump